MWTRFSGVATTSTARLRWLAISAALAVNSSSPPLEMPLDMRPYGMAGIAAYFSTRIDGTQKTRSLGGGTTWALGLDIPAGPGIIAPELAINTGRQSFDNTNITGGEARERVGGFRGNVSYRYVF